MCLINILVTGFYIQLPPRNHAPMQLLSALVVISPPMPDYSTIFYICCLVTERLRYSFNHVIPVSGWHPHLSGSSSPRIGGIPGLRLLRKVWIPSPYLLTALHR